MKLNTRINGRDLYLEIKPNATLLETLRQAGFKSVKYGCGEGMCGACAVMIDGKPRTSCITLAGTVEGREIITVEGMGNPDKPHALQQAFVDAGATQCGYCNPGSLIAAKALLDSNPNPTAEDVKDALDGNLCRCSGYVKRIEAVLSAAGSTAPAAKQKKSPGDKK